MADLHFQVRGPIIGAARATRFAIDWRFAAAEDLAPPPSDGGAAGQREPADWRRITEGPDEDTDKLLYVILAGALSVARQQILIMTPYFIPQPGAHIGALPGRGAAGG